MLRFGDPMLRFCDAILGFGDPMLRFCDPMLKILTCGASRNIYRLTRVPHFYGVHKPPPRGYCNESTSIMLPQLDCIKHW